MRANNGPFMNKDLTKAIIKRTRLGNSYLKLDAVLIGRHIMPKGIYEKKRQIRLL